MLDLVVAEFHGLASRQPRRDVSRDAQAVPVRMLGEGRHQLGLQRAVQLDLHHSQRGVLVDPFAPGLFIVHQHLGRSLVWAGPIHEARHDDARADLGAFVDALLAGEQLVDIIGQVSHGRHARGEVEQAVVLGDVRVHVPEAWDERLSRSLDHLESRRWRGGRPYADDAAPVDHHILVRDHAAALRVEQVGIVDHELAARPVRQPLRLIARALLIRVLLHLDQLGHRRFPALADHRLPGAAGREVFALRVQPDVGGREAETGHRIERHGLRSVSGLGHEVAHLGDPGLSIGQQGDATSAIQGCAREQRKFDRRSVHRGVEGRHL